jgi:hypothetical protein
LRESLSRHRRFQCVALQHPTSIPVSEHTYSCSSCSYRIIWAVSITYAYSNFSFCFQQCVSSRESIFTREHLISIILAWRIASTLPGTSTHIAYRSVAADYACMGGCHLVTTLDEAFAFVTRGLNLPFSDSYLLPLFSSNIMIMHFQVDGRRQHCLIFTTASITITIVFPSKGKENTSGPLIFCFYFCHPSPVLLQWAQQPYRLVSSGRLHVGEKLASCIVTMSSQ